MKSCHVDDPTANQSGHNTRWPPEASNSKDSTIIKQDREFGRCDWQRIHDLESEETFVESEDCRRTGHLGVFAKAMFYHYVGYELCRPVGLTKDLRLQ